MRSSILGLLGLVACRFGGPIAETDDYLAFPDAPDRRGADAASSSDDASSATPPGDALTGSSGDDTSGGETSGDDSPSGDLTEGGACSPAVAVCDPVHDTGCNSLQQCDVNPFTTTPTGVCVFAAPAEGGACLFTVVTESCPPKFSCVGGRCRQLCFCDVDCPSGQCCSDSSGPSGFTLCRPCP